MDTYGIDFKGSDMSFTTIWTDMGDVLHIGHAGVLIEDDDGLIFIEKTNPFSLIRLPSFILSRS